MVTVQEPSAGVPAATGKGGGEPEGHQLPDRLMRARHFWEITICVLVGPSVADP